MPDDKDGYVGSPTGLPVNSSGPEYNEEVPVRPVRILMIGEIVWNPTTSAKKNYGNKAELVCSVFGSALKKNRNNAGLLIDVKLG